MYNFEFLFNVVRLEDNMKKTKITFISFIVIVLSTTVVVFNNSMDLFERMFYPQINIFIMLSLGIFILPVIWYVVYNWNKK